MSGATDQLRRLLTLLPLAGRPEGVSFDEAAHALGVDVHQVMADIQVLTDRTFYLPAGSTVDLQVAMAGDRIRIFGPNLFRRPLRLTRGELLALSVALRVAGLESDESREILADIERELAGRGTDPRTVAEGLLGEDVTPYASEHLPQRPEAREHPDGIRGAFSEAVLARRRVSFGYLKPGAQRAEPRTVEPWRLLHSEGEWYVVGRDPAREGLRLFRLDRVLGARVEEARFTPDPEFDARELVRGGQVMLLAEGAAPEEVTVRYSERVARWVAEGVHGEALDDGGYLVRHRIHERRWLLREVMRYGGEASVHDAPSRREA